MAWEVEVTNEFIDWWNHLTDSQQVDVDSSVGLLEKLGPQLSYPHSSGINGSKYSHMRELRIQSKGSPLRILYAYDPRRIAILLGGDKTGNEKWYEKNVPLADQLYSVHLNEIGAN